MYVLPAAPPPPPLNKRTSMLETRTLSARNTPLPPIPPPPPILPPAPPAHPAPTVPPPPYKPSPLPPPPVPSHQPSRPLGRKSQDGSVRIPPQRPPVRTGSMDKRAAGSSQPKSSQGSSPPTPRPRTTFSQKPQRVKAIYNCSADNPDELTFSEGEVIVVEGEEDSEWWIGHVEGEPARRGVFPVTFVHFITD